jgi:hypothetical protein
MTLEFPANVANAKTEEAARPTLCAGLITGLLLMLVLFGALVAANRVPSLEPYALERNAVSYTVFVLVMLIPVVRFLSQPIRLFASGMIGWVLFAAAYDVAGSVFRDLFDVLRTPFEALIEGALVYGTIAVALWVCEMALHSRRNPIVSVGRRALRHAERHHSRRR